MAEKHIKLYNKSVVLWKLYMEKFQLKKGRNFFSIFFLFRKAHLHLLKIVKIMLICWIYLKFQIDYLNFLEEVEYTWLGANIIILYEEKKRKFKV